MKTTGFLPNVLSLRNIANREVGVEVVKKAFLSMHKAFPFLGKSGLLEE
ncbi:hypothetical protein CP061683_0079A, partial [Chlamydia psittaci 06-1683]